MARRCTMKKMAVAVVALAAGPALVWAGQGPFVVGNGQLGFLETTVAPHVRCLGGEVTSGAFPYCSGDTQRIFGFGEQQLWWPETLSETVTPYLTGPIMFEVNCSFDPQFRGPCWGTFTWEVPGGTWKGHWTAPLMDLLTYESEIHMVGNGEGGDIDGMKLQVDGASAPGDWYVGFHARLRK
jgi:hypothetical protein